MRYLALAADYDGTLASDGTVKHETLAALRRLRRSGRRIILITGRRLEDLLRLFPCIDVVDRIVAENGALVFSAADGHVGLHGAVPPEEFITRLRTRGVDPLSIGRVIVATEHRHERVVRDTVRDFGLDVQVILNKGAMMILPARVDKATGLRTALAQLRLAPSDTVGIGDAENDEGFLAMCGRSVVVADALPAVKVRADWVTTAANGNGVIELIDRLVASDLQDVPPKHAMP